MDACCCSCPRGNLPLLGQPILPRGGYPMADRLERDELESVVDEVRAVTAKCAPVMLARSEFIAAHCAAGRP